MEPREREQMPFLLLLPNLVTIAGMCLGLTSIRYTMVAQFETAVVLVLMEPLANTKPATPRGLSLLMMWLIHA